MHTAATSAPLNENNNGQQTTGQMCHQPIRPNADRKAVGSLAMGVELK